MFDHCELFRRNVEAMSSYGGLMDKYRQQIAYLQEKTGVQIGNPYIFQKVLDGIKTRASHQNSE